MGISVRPIAQSCNWHEANLRGYTNSADGALTQLKDVTTLMELNLSGTKFSDASAANLKSLVSLTHLHLEHTSITDGGLANVKEMAHLTYLNLFDTAITDAGLEHLAGSDQFAKPALLGSQSDRRRSGETSKGVAQVQHHPGCGTAPDR